MICLDCAAKHPQFKPLEQPVPMEELPCTVCGEVKLCVPNHEVGLPGMTPDEAFKMMAKMIKP
jgi:hypothetical protein